jgi:hypothetical protein
MFRGRCRHCWPFVVALLAAAALVSATGCSMIIPEIAHQPVIHNPFPQLSKVAIVPFFNQSDEPTVDGREFALAYFAELQNVPGFEVVPVGVVEEAILDEQIDVSNPEGIRRLANVLDVDAVVVGSVTDYSPYYPPRCGMRVEWYAANAGFHEIPAGYGLPWGTPDEEYIPAPLVFEAEMALAKAQLDTQTPNCPKPGPKPLTPMLPQGNGALIAPQPRVNANNLLPGGNNGNAAPGGNNGAHNNGANGGEILPPQSGSPSGSNEATPPANGEAGSGNKTASYEESCPCNDRGPDLPPALPLGAAAVAGGLAPGMPGNFDPAVMTGGIGAGAILPPDWPDERGFIPPGPSPTRAPCIPNNGPIMTHTRIYIGNDSEFTEALASYYSFRDDARFGGWQNYLQRSSDFIRFCCHMHISEMLSARGGAGETRVVWRWPESR